LAIQNLGPDDKNKLKDIFGEKNSSDESIKEIVNKIALVGIDKDVRSVAQDYIEDAFGILDKYDVSNPLLSLKNSARYIVERGL
jgi:geranylgeranyl pyrophosphate synthase